MKRSHLEDELVLHCKAVGLPTEEPYMYREYRFAPPRRWRFDLAWPRHGVAAEVEGGMWLMGRHQRPKGFELDCFKYNASCLGGWRVLRFTGNMIKSGYAVRTLEEALTLWWPI